MKQDLSDMTFMIPVKIDSEDRINNLNIITMYLREHFNTNIIIAEQNVVPKIPDLLCKTLYNTYIHYKTDNFFFHKTRLVNTMIKCSKTPLVAMYDSDVLFRIEQYSDAVNKLRNGSVDFAYPFNGQCVNVKRSDVPRVMETLNFDFVRHVITNGKNLAMGGCVMYNKNKFITAGMMNENFISYGPEDGEQDFRLMRLGYKGYRVPSPLYHLDHIRTVNSSENHKFSKQNWNEFNKIKRMQAADLKRYVATWGWVKPISNSSVSL